jgi:hypothetical protein
LRRLPSGLEPSGDLLSLVEIFVSRAPEDEASGDSPDGDRNTELCGDAEDAVFHRGSAGAVWERHAGGGVVQGLDFLLEGAIKLRVHAGSAAHAASFVERDVFEFDGR